MNLSALLKKYLDKVGVSDFTQLDDTERGTYDEWRKVLESEVTLADVEKFIKVQILRLNTELQKAVREGNDREAYIALARLENYNDLIAVIGAPERNREVLAAHIDNLLKND